MIMSELLGDPQDKIDFVERIRLAAGRPNRYVMGSVGRWALQHALRWPGTPPLTVRQPDGWLRDIDVFAPKERKVWKSKEYPEELEIDLSINEIIPGDPPTIGPRRHRVKLTDSRLFRQVIRRVGGVEVPTLPLGTHFLIEQLLSPKAVLELRYRHLPLEIMHRFTAWARPRYPQEFLDNAAYEPYLDYIRWVERDISPLMTPPA